MCNVQLAIWGTTGRKDAESKGAPERGASGQQGLPAGSWSCTRTRVQLPQGPGMDVCKAPKWPCGHGCQNARKAPGTGTSGSLTTPGSHPLPFNSLSEDRASQRRVPPCLCSLSEQSRKPVPTQLVAGAQGAGRSHASVPRPSPPFPARVCWPWHGVQLDTRCLKERCSNLQGPAPHPTNHVPLRPPSTQGTRPPNRATRAEDLCLQLHLS